MVWFGGYKRFFTALIGFALLPLRNWKQSYRCLPDTPGMGRLGVGLDL